MNATQRKSTLAVVDPVSSAVKTVLAARERGYDVVEVRTFSVDQPYYARSYRPELFARTVIHDGDLSRTLAALQGVDRVVIGADSGVPIAEQLQAARGELRNDLALSEARYDKAAQAKALAAAGVPIAAQQHCLTVDAALRFAEGRYPVVLKPTASAGTDGVFLVREPESLRVRFAELLARQSLYGRPNLGALVMDYIAPDAASEFVVDAVSAGGVRVVTDVWRYEKVAMHGTPAMYRVARTVPLAEARAEIEFAFRVLDAVGHHHGPSHTELWRLDDAALRDRYQSAHLPVETASRLPGVIPALSAAAFGRDQVELGLDAVLSPDAFPAVAAEAARIDAGRHAAVVLLAAAHSGRLLRDVPNDRLRALPSYHSDWFLAQRAGDSVSKTVDLPTIIGWVGLVSGDRAALERDIAAVQAMEAEIGQVESAGAV